MGTINFVLLSMKVTSSGFIDFRDTIAFNKIPKNQSSICWNMNGGTFRKYFSEKNH